MAQAPSPFTAAFLPPGYRPVERNDGVLPEAGGNPRGDGGGIEGGYQSGTMDPAKISEGRRKAGRPRGSGRKWSAERRAAYEQSRNSTPETQEELAVEDSEPKPKPVPHEVVEQVAAALRFTQSLMTPDMPLSDEEAIGLAKAVTNLLAYYVKLGGGGRGMAWLALFGALAMIELPRLMVVSARNKEKREAKLTPAFDPGSA